MTPNARLVDEIRELEAKAAGKRLELCMRLDDREGAEQNRREMYALIEARRAAADVELHDPAGCFFAASGHADSLKKGAVAHA